MTINQAISKLAFVEFGEWEFYFSILSNEEECEELEEVKEAREVAFEHNITHADIEKHYLRSLNVVPAPIRFIDRPHFIAVETDELPF